MKNRKFDSELCEIRSCTIKLYIVYLSLCNKKIAFGV